MRRHLPDPGYHHRRPMQARACRSKSITAAASSANCAPRPCPTPGGIDAIGGLGFRGAPARGPGVAARGRGARARCRNIQRIPSSLHIRHVDAGSCNGCESELRALNNPFYNLHRLGIFFTASPRFADLLLVTGPVTHAMAAPLRARLGSDAPAALGHGDRNLRGIGWCCRRRLCQRPWPRRSGAGRSLPSRLPAQPGGDDRGLVDVSGAHAAARRRRPAWRMTYWPRRRCSWLAGGAAR